MSARFVMLPDGWPLVDKYDDGIRPAGRPDECFYCRQRVGKPHGSQCVIVTKVVELRVLAKLPDGKIAAALWQIDEPHAWTPEQITRRYNKSSWCQGNFLGSRTRDGRSDRGTVTWDEGAGDPWQALERLYESGNCLCGLLSFAFVRVIDNTPRRDLHVHSHLPPGIA
jgi:hypothetical protein